MDVGRLDRNRLLTVVCAAAFIASLAACIWLLGEPASGHSGPRVRPAGIQQAHVAADVAAPLVSLLSPGAVSTDVQVLGVLSGTRDALALLSINGGAPQTFAAGQRLGPSSVLVRITADAVEVEQAGQRRSLAVPMLPPIAETAIVSSRPMTTP